jgi:hypothetical protein
MKKQINILKRKQKEVVEHKGIKQLESKRLILKKATAESQTFVLRNKKEYLIGCQLIKNILKYKTENRLIYFTGKQAEQILKKYPEINTPTGVKSLLVASLNPNLTTLKINSLVLEIFSKEMPLKDRKQIIYTMIRSIKPENYKHLL